MKLGISMTNNITHFLQTKDRTRNKRLEKLKLKETKKSRLKKVNEGLKEHTAIARRERAKRDCKSVQTMVQTEGFVSEGIR
jgi:hypothetical protein